MTKKIFNITSVRGYTLKASPDYLPEDDQIEHDARVLFSILIHEHVGKVTNRVLELYKLWDEYTELDETPLENFSPDKFLEALDAGKVHV